MWAGTDNILWRIKYFVIFKQKKVKAWTQHKVNLHFLNTLSLNNTRTSLLIGSNSGGTIITFFWARVFALVYITLIATFDGELTKSTIAAAASPLLSHFDGEFVKSTMAALAFFLAGLPLLTALDGELGKSTMGGWMGGWFCSKFCEGRGWFCSGGGWFYWTLGLVSITVATIPFIRFSSSSKCLT